jgi:hypothetical protein
VVSLFLTKGEALEELDRLRSATSYEDSYHWYIKQTMNKSKHQELIER